MPDSDLKIMYDSVYDNAKIKQQEGEINRLLDDKNRTEFEHEEALNTKKIQNQQKLLDLLLAGYSRREKLELSLQEKLIDFQKAQNDATNEALIKYYTKKEEKENEFQKKFADYAVKKGLGEAKLRRDELLRATEKEHIEKMANIKAQANLSEKERQKQIKAEDKRYKEQRKQKLKDATEDIKKLNKEEAKFRRKTSTEERTQRINDMRTAMQKNGLIGGLRKAVKTDGTAAENVLGTMSTMISYLGDALKQLDKQIDDIASKKSSIDTRLQGSKLNQRNGYHGSSYWDQMSKDITGIAGVSPLVKQSAIVDKLTQMVSKGIAYNVEQRAFIETVKDKIATTFSAFDSTLLRLIRIQEKDSTAARLGMESALTSFLNNMYETTEYLSDVASSVRQQLEQAEALMNSEKAVAFEYQVQKWLGSMYSVGMSNSATSSIASALGKLSSGDISDLSGQGIGNLVIMAANQSGQSISDLLAKGLDESTTNELMKSMVGYLADLYNSSKDNFVVQQQLAKVYGLTAADLKAAASLSKGTTTSNIYSNYLGYGDALSQLNSMANSMYSRTSIGEMMGNVLDNVKYSMSAGIASNPALYAVFKGANLLDSLTGGLEFSLPMFMGTGTTQTFNIADIMRIGALSGSIYDMIAAMTSANSAGGGWSGEGMLKALGVGSGTGVVRGTGKVGTTARGITTSEGGAVVGNNSSEDAYNKYYQDTYNNEQQKVEAASADSDEVTLKTVNKNVYDIFTLLQSVVNGNSVLNVKVSNYGLTGWN